MARFYLDEAPTPKRGRMPAHPRNREKDPEAYDAAQQWMAERQQRKQQQEEQNRVYVKERAKRNEEAATELNRRKDVVMSAMSDIANNIPFTGAEVKEAADNQRQEKLDRLHQTKNVIDATATVAEAAAAWYGILRGLTHLRRLGLRKATQSTGQAVSRQAMTDLANYNRLVQKVDAPQVYMNGLGGGADLYQWFTANNTFDKYENGIETGMNTAGVVGGTNWFKNLPALRAIGGNKIDAILDGMGYSAAAWDIIKNLPPLSYQLDKARENFK